WVKVQGRFEDVPFVDTAEQTRTLIASAFTEPSTTFSRRLDSWALSQTPRLAGLALGALAVAPKQLAACWPLHPAALAVLPGLCHRYGQTERTMCSFLAGNEPRSVSRFLADRDLPRSGELPTVSLPEVYDYFVDSAASMVGVSADASRWIEIDTRIRDTRGLT